MTAFNLDYYKSLCLTVAGNTAIERAQRLRDVLKTAGFYSGEQRAKELVPIRLRSATHLGLRYERMLFEFIESVMELGFDGPGVAYNNIPPTVTWETRRGKDREPVSLLYVVPTENLRGLCVRSDIAKPRGKPAKKSWYESPGRDFIRTKLGTEDLKEAVEFFLTATQETARVTGGLAWTWDKSEYL